MLIKASPGSDFGLPPALHPASLALRPDILTNASWKRKKWLTHSVFKLEVFFFFKAFIYLILHKLVTLSFLPSSVSVCPPSILSQGQPAPKPRQTALREVPLVLAEVAFERKKSRVRASPARTPGEVKEQPRCVRAASAGGSARSGPRGRCTGRARPCVCRHLAAAEEMAAARLGHRGSGPSPARPSQPIWHRAPPRDPPPSPSFAPRA